MTVLFFRNLIFTGLVSAQVSCAGTLDSAPVPTAGVRVSGLALDLNGQTEIPVGLFGVHAMGKLDAALAEEWGIEAVRYLHQQPDGRPSVAGGNVATAPAGAGRVAPVPSLVVDCYFDRYQPARQIVDRNWRASLEKLARDYGKNARKTGRPHYLEFWNEPFLNWATKPGVNFSPEYFVTDGIKSGDPMVSKATGKPVEGLVWDKEIFFVQADDGKGINHVLSSYVPRNGKEGETVTLGYGAGPAVLKDGGTVKIRGKDRVLTKRWSGRDTGQKFYWTGPVGERLYNEMFAVFGPALKQANPDVQLAAGWGFNFHNEDWAVWDMLIRPTIDKNHDWFDALHEHHYGGDTRRVAAGYEVAYAYTLARHGKRIQFWNTEAGGNLDPQHPGNAYYSSQGDPVTRAVAAFTYFTRDVTFLLDRMPDKAVQRSAHEPDHNGGDLPAFAFFKPLRGRLLAVDGGSPQVWSVAAVAGDRLSVLVFNDADEPREVPVAVNAPAGAALAGATERRMVVARREPGPGPLLRIEETPREAAGGAWNGALNLGAKQAAMLVSRLPRPPDLPARVVRRQYSSGDVLQSLVEGGVETLVNVPAEAVSSAATARLRLVTDTAADLTVTLNGERVFSGQAGAMIRDIEVPVTLLKPENRLRFEGSPAQGRILATGLYLEVKR